MLEMSHSVRLGTVSSLSLLYGLTSLFFLHGSTGLLIPEPTGRYAVALSTTKLVDESRVDPFDTKHGYRNVMTSLFYPIDRNKCEQMCAVPYMPPVTAVYAGAFFAQFGAPSDNETFGAIQLQVCCKPSTAAAKNATNFPLVLFSPGLGSSRLLYNALAQNLASAGYAVVTFDSAFDATIPYNTSYASEQLVALVETRNADARFVLAQYGSEQLITTLIPGATSGFNTTRVAIYGHSLGGATAVGTLMQDERFVGAINLDGSQFGPLYDTHRPVLLFGRAEPTSHNRTDDATWQKAWGFLKGWRRELGIHDIQHVAYGDYALLIKLEGWPLTDGIKAMIGTLDGQRAFDVQSRYIQAFIDFVLKGERSNLLVRPSDAYPEVVVGDGNE
ncbi:Alpha/Beta hydrolase protein [Lophiotrema nucula]|uniref:1-alkyl-2-acetylglycerophosphocholine esterase n=1 Tax=Lophiotrema nucula TaxID=690887 RepID=A0A6A5YU40_9PLEO|nr:Alpha/Beta hydrolase protein [Lophiotrema nucula]